MFIKRFCIILVVPIFYILCFNFIDLSKLLSSLGLLETLQGWKFLILEIVILFFWLPPILSSLSFLIGSGINLLSKRILGRLYITEKFIKDNFYNAIETFLQLLVYSTITVWFFVATSKYFPQIDKMPNPRFLNELFKFFIIVGPTLPLNYFLGKCYRLIDDHEAGKYTFRTNIVASELYGSATRVVILLLPMLYVYATIGCFDPYGKEIITILSLFLSINLGILAVMYMLIPIYDTKLKIIQQAKQWTSGLSILVLYTIPLFGQYNLSAKKLFSDFFSSVVFVYFWSALIGHKNFFLRTRSRKLQDLHYYSFLGSISAGSIGFIVLLMVRVRDAYGLKTFNVFQYSNYILYFVLAILALIYSLFYLIKKPFFKKETSISSLVFSLLLISSCIAVKLPYANSRIYLFFLVICFSILMTAIIGLKSVNIYFVFTANLLIPLSTIVILLDYLGFFTFRQLFTLFSLKSHEIFTGVLIGLMVYLLQPYLDKIKNKRISK